MWTESIRSAMEWAALGLDVAAVAVIVRITLTWSLVVEAEGRWPWQTR